MESVAHVNQEAADRTAGPLQALPELGKLTAQSVHKSSQGMLVLLSSAKYKRSTTAVSNLTKHIKLLDR